ncbi:hypothetical protein [Streptomyces lasiicapitis]|uniref:Uncharacterized protein n=1 Tax=Streptomyces lasiicapitis TaxID=1923961 RepID=A0ABQ2M2A7_9ACTN|nr:hypothetical protein [Streptomyces lasiicapitis]GGO46014.1 hypothetical protein GCM10012286_35930 [Streptomyces lasiicapitis]
MSAGQVHSHGHNAGGAEEFRVRVQAAADTSYRWQWTARGFDLAVDVPVPGRRQVHTYRVELRPQERTFTVTDVVDTMGRGPGGGRQRETGRIRYRTWSSSPDGTERHSFSSAEGHRLIRGVAQELGWRETRPATMKAGLAFGAFGGIVALGTLIALAIAFWP